MISILKYTPSNWYWVVKNSDTQVYSSAAKNYVPNDDLIYQNWLTKGFLPTRISSEYELGEVLEKYGLLPAPGVLSGYNPVPEEISDRQFFQQLAVMQVITENEALDAVKTGTIPAMLASYISTLPIETQFPAQMLVSGAVTFKRHHPMTLALAAGMGWTDDQVDDLWRAASIL